MQIPSTQLRLRHPLFIHFVHFSAPSLFYTSTDYGFATSVTNGNAVNFRRVRSPKRTKNIQRSKRVEFVRDLPDRVKTTSHCHRLINADYDRCRDPQRTLLGPLDDEFEHLPYANEDSNSSADSNPEQRETVAIIYITEFFTNGRDFAYYVLGRTNVSALCAGMLGMEAYYGPLSATPIIIHDHEALQEDRQSVGIGKKMGRSLSRMGAMKWRYLYETGRIAWSKLLVHPRKLDSIRRRNIRDMQHAQYLAGRDPSDD